MLRFVVVSFFESVNFEELSIKSLILSVKCDILNILKSEHRFSCRPVVRKRNLYDNLQAERL